jgi:hypothetical protein
MRDIIYNGPECEVEAVCYILDTEDVALEVEYKYAVQRKPEPKGCAEGFCGGCDCLGEGGES